MRWTRSDDCSSTRSCTMLAVRQPHGRSRRWHATGRPNGTRPPASAPQSTRWPAASPLTSDLSPENMVQDVRRRLTVLRIKTAESAEHQRLLYGHEDRLGNGRLQQPGRLPATQERVSRREWCAYLTRDRH